MKEKNTLSIHQPNFVPWVGYFIKVYLSEKHVILDDVEYSKNNWINRNKIFINEDIFLTIPVKKEDINKKINEVRLGDNYQHTINKMIKMFNLNYKKLPGFETIEDLFLRLNSNNFTTLYQVNSFLLRNILDYLDIRTEIMLSSEIMIDKNLKSNDYLIAICKKLECSSYLSGQGARDYLDESLFKKNNIDVIWINNISKILDINNTTPNSIIEFIATNGDQSSKIINNIIEKVPLYGK